MAWLRSALFALLFYTASVPIVVFGTLVALVRPASITTTTRIWAELFWVLVRVVLGIRVVVNGTPPQHAVIVASKHQSAFETIAILHLFRRPAPVMKAELMKVPFWGWLAGRFGCIPVDRDGQTGAMRAMMKAARAAIAADKPIIIFPEGSRIAVGESPPLKAGVSGLYKVLKLPVVPMALDSGRLWPRQSFIKRPGTITMSFGEPIPPGLPRDEFESRVHAAINRVP